MSHGLRSTRSGSPASPPYWKGPYEWDQEMEHTGLFTASKPGLSLSRYVLTEYFHKLPKLNADIQNADEAVRMIANTDFEILGTNASNDDVTFSTTVAGIDLETDTAANDQVIILPHLDAGQTSWTQIKWGTENQVIWECLLRTGASIADVVIWAGLKLTNTSVVATDNDQVFFRFDGAVANWEPTYSIGGTDTEVDSGVAVAANTNYHLRIVIDSDRVAKFYINKNLVATSTALTNDVDLIPYVGVQTTTTAAKKIILCGQQISRIVFE